MAHVREARSCPNPEHRVARGKAGLEADIVFVAEVCYPGQLKVSGDHLVRPGDTAHCPLAAAVSYHPYHCPLAARCLAWSCCAMVAHNHHHIHHPESRHSQGLVVHVGVEVLAVHLFGCPGTVCRHIRRPSWVSSAQALCLPVEACFVFWEEGARHHLGRQGHSCSYSPYRLEFDFLRPSRNAATGRPSAERHCQSFALGD